MAKYFNFFPKTVYSNLDVPVGVDTVTNIMARFGFESNLKNNSSIFYEYNVQDGDTPESIAASVTSGDVSQLVSIDRAIGLGGGSHEIGHIICDMAGKNVNSDVKLCKDNKNHSYLQIGQTKIYKNDFDNIRRIICYQNMPDFNDSYIDPELKKALDEEDKMKEKQRE